MVLWQTAMTGTGELAGSFYWRFNHSGGDSPRMVAGFTEDTVYGTLGLSAAASLKVNLQNEEMQHAVLLAQETVLEGLGADGTVHGELCCQDEMRHASAGEMLQGTVGRERISCCASG